MALNDMQLQAIQESEDIESGKDTRTKSEMIADQMEGLKTFGKGVRDVAVESIPGVGEAIAEKRIDEALEQGDTTGAMFEGAAMAAGVIPIAGDVLAKGIRAIKPKKTVKAYKLFRQGEDGNLYPLFVDADTPIKQGEFIEAVIPETVFTAPNGKRYVPSMATGGKKGTGDSISIPDQETRDMLIEYGFLPKGSKAKTVKAVALRPGWHAGDSPAAPHIGSEYKGKKYRDENQVWAEVEMPADYDWQSVANSNASTVKSGKRKGLLNAAEAQITDQLPSGGYYRYKTNPNMQGNWLISGEMKVNRVLDADEVKKLNKEAGVDDLPTLSELKNEEAIPTTRPAKLESKSALRKLFDKLPKAERDALPAQPDENRIFGYHGTARARERGEPFFDINFARKNDQFLGEGFYFTLDPKIADEYANLRAFRDFDIVEAGGRGKPTVMKHRETGEVTTVENLMQGQNIEGQPLAMGQNVGRFDLSNLEKPYVVTTEKQRKELKAKIPQLKEEGYDSVLFADFKDRSKQIMVFPESMDKINSDAINYAQGGTVMDDYQFAELELDKKQNFASGGMPQQMEMFDEGGLKDEGGTVDPVSGNDVPPGSTQEEVRDDIPAQLSEGEFVFPADVVRFIGLNKLMQMRQEAKMGLKMMDEMGQMGNSDEATIPDDIPFSIADLVVVTSDKEDVDTEDKKEYNTGGLASNFGVTYQAPQFQPTTTVGQAAPIPTAPVYTPAAQQNVPVAQPPQTLPTGQEFLTAEQAAPQTITIVNEETGEERVITFIPGVTQIPQGFVRKEDYTPKEVVPEVPSTTVQTAQVTEGRGDDDRQKKEEEMYGPGGGRVGVGGEIYGVSFDMPEGSLLPGVGGVAATAFGLATGKPLPENTVVNFKRGEIEFSVTGKQYNEFKAQAQESGYNSKEAKQKFDRMMAESSAKEAEEARKKKEAAMKAIEAAADAAARKEAEKEKQRQQAIEQQKLKQLSEANINTMYGRSEDRNERQEQQAQNQREADTFTREAVSDVAGRVASGRGFNKGGDVTEQMKKSGLSSKK